jgi:hypothetical protein
MPAEPSVSQSPLRFRGIPDSLASLHLEGLECCLIHADSPLQQEKQTYVNPHILVGYDGDAYRAMHPQQLFSSPWQISKALWENRVRRWMTVPALKDWIIHGRVKRWEAMSRDHKERGIMCLVNEMQILAENGWVHV